MNLTNDRARLKEILLRHSVLRGDFVLASGKRSSVYVDCRLTTLRGEAMPLIGRLMLELFRKHDWTPDAVGGMTMGADPVACAIAREGLRQGGPACAFVVRKAGKGHGRKRFIEGIASLEGVRCVVLDDVCTTGGSTVRALERVEDAGMEILGVGCMVDREQGAREAITALGYEFDALFTMQELLEG